MSSEFFSNNRKALVGSLEDYPIVVSANGLLQRSADTNFRFRQDSNFWYLTGLEEPDLLLIIDGRESTIVLPEREVHRDLWEGKIDKVAIQKMSGVQQVINFDEFIEWLKTTNKIYRPAPPEAYIAGHGLFTNPARVKLETLLSEHKIEAVDCRIELARLRQIKQPSELAAITKAVSATCHTLAEIKQNLSQFESEDELERAVSIGFLKQGLAEHAYQPIVATGKNATTLHYVKNNAPLESNDLVLLDVGAEYINYAADITRTWAFGKISARQKLVHRLVCELQDYAFAFLKSGVLMKDYENAMRAEAARICKKAGLIQNEDEINKIYPHATSHFLGLDVHDAADYNLPLAENMVLTVEPGIYLPSEGIGVRIEDDVVVTKKAVKIISNDLSRQL